MIPVTFKATYETGHEALDMRKCNANDQGIVLGGGNVVCCGDKIVMTEKVIDENPQWTQRNLVKKLGNLFQGEIIILPWDKREIYGLTDGILRYAGNDKVILYLTILFVCRMPSDKV